MQLDLFSARFVIDEFTGRFQGLQPIPAGLAHSTHSTLKAAEQAAHQRNKTTKGRLCVVVDRRSGRIIY